MEIKFVWINDYKNIKKTGFNFKRAHGETFEYKKGNLNFTKNEIKSPAGFFGSNISNVTAIVGMNGAGKSNLGEFIYYNLVHVRNGKIAFFEKSEGIIILGNQIFISDVLPFDNYKSLEEQGFEIFWFKNAPMDKISSRKWRNMEKNKYIFYSPMFDKRFRPWRNMSNNIQDISTGHLIWNDKNNSTKYLNQEVDLRVSNLEANFRNEVMRESDVLMNFPEVGKWIPLHREEISFQLDARWNNGLLSPKMLSKKEVDGDSERVEYNEVITYLDDLEKRIRLDNYRTKFDHENYAELYRVPATEKVSLFTKVFFIGLFKVYLLQPDATLHTSDLKLFFYGARFRTQEGKIDEKIIQINSTLQDLLDKAIWEAENKVLQEGDSRWQKQREVGLFEIYGSFILKGEDSQDLLVKLISEVKDFLDGNIHFHYEFLSDYSSGQEKLLNFFARFYYAQKEIKQSERVENGVEGEQIVIFIDEGEVGMHPEWQRQFFSIALDFISELFSDYKVQLILTTHSPFVLSELPKDNIIFLNRNVDGNAELASFDRENTFGANIYSLLADSFFMTEGTIGEFSAKKIQWVLGKLDVFQDLTTKELEEVDFIISNIGEPIIKMELERIRRHKSGESEVSKLRLRVKELEDKINGNDKA